MECETLITDFLEQVPELRNKAEEEAEFWRGMSDEDFKEYREAFASFDKELKINLPAIKGSDSPQSFFLFVPSLFLKETLPEIKDKGLFKRMFDFFESMAASDDEKVRYILIYNILARIGQYPENLKTVWPFMGEKTRYIMNELDKFWGEEKGRIGITNLDIKPPD